MPADSLHGQLQLSLGTTYIIERELGGGGMSRVFLAEETAFGRRVVIKLLAPELAAGVNLDRFRREIQVAARLQHPHIVPVIAAGESGGLPWYSMPFVEGESLRARIDGCHPERAERVEGSASSAARMPLSDTIVIMRDVARALAYAHERGIVHRDIKPDNVLLSGGSAMVADFGIAKALSAARLASDADTLTQLGTSIGTPAYMAPEQAAGDPAVDHRADIYAFGCVAYELLAGRPPFADRTPQRMLAAHMMETPEPIASIRRDAPAALTALVMRCLAKEPADRPQSAADVVVTLESTVSGAMPAAAPLGLPRILRNTLLVYVAAFVAVAVVARTAMLALGLPDWILPGALSVMALGVPAILLARYGNYSLRRTARWGAYAIGAFVALVAITSGLRAAGIGPFGTLFAAGTLKAGDAIVVSDFTVSNSADSSLGRAIADGVKADLAQFAGVSVVPETRITAALESMDRANARLLEPVARDVALRVGARAVLGGTMTPVGNGFLVVMRLVTPDSGRELASVRKGADSPSQLIAIVGELTRDLRGKMGESLRSVRATPPLADVMTASLPALRKYSDAMLARREGDRAAFARLLHEAIERDSTFAAAYRTLAQEYTNWDIKPAETADLLARGMLHKDRLSERQRLYLVSQYYRSGPLSARNADSAQVAINAVIARFPDAISMQLAGLMAIGTGQPARADSLFRRAAAIDSTYANPLRSLFVMQLDDAHLAAAETTYSRLQRRVGAAELLPFLMRLQLARGDTARAESTAREACKTNATAPGRRQECAEVLATSTQLRGALRESGVWRARAASAAASRGSPSPALVEWIDAANAIALLVGDQSRALHVLDSAVAVARIDTLPALERPDEALANAYAMAGQPARARTYLAELGKQHSANELFYNGYRVRHARARIALAERRWNDALADVDERREGRCRSCAWLIRAMAYDGRGDRDSAIVLYERYANRLEPDALNTPSVIRRLGELWEQKADAAKAIARYRQFVGLWKNADPELQPQVADVARRIARLQASEARKR